MISPILTHPGAGNPLSWLTRALGLTPTPTATPAVSHGAGGLGVGGALAIATATLVLVGVSAVALSRLARAHTTQITARRARWTTAARWIEIFPPPLVDAHSATAFWSHMAGLSREHWPRIRHGQPHLAFEIHAGHGGLRCGVWVPAVISPRRVEHAIRAAWPGATTRTHHTTIPHPLAHTTPTTGPTTGPTIGPRTGLASGSPAGSAGVSAGGGRQAGVRVVCAGWAPLGRHPLLPLRTRHDTDPLRAILAAMSGLGVGESACLQICARPASGPAAARLRRAATHPTRAARGWRARLWWHRWLTESVTGPAAALAGPAAGLLAWLTALTLPALTLLLRAAAVLALALAQEGLQVLASLFTPTPRRSRHTHPRGHRRPPAAPSRQTPPTTSPTTVLASALGMPSGAISTATSRENEVSAKTSEATTLWEFQLRFAATLTPPHPPNATRWRQSRRACGARAGALAGALAVYGGHNFLLRRPLPPTNHPAMTDRWITVPGQLLSTAELAALAHLPTDPRVPGLTRATAPALAPHPALRPPPTGHPS